MYSIVFQIINCCTYRESRIADIGNRCDGCDQGGARLQGHFEGRSPHADTAAGQSFVDLDLKSLCKCIGLESYRFI